jgi:integrase
LLDTPQNVNPKQAHAGGQRLTGYVDFRGAWDALEKAAGIPGLLLHDLRRSAVRSMIRRGVPQKTAQRISGHKTDAVFNRYNIISKGDIEDAARKIEEGAKAAQASPNRKT